MPTAEAARLIKLVRDKIGELKGVCKGIDEETASRAPEGRWSPKQVLSHLCGPDGSGLLPSFKAFVERDVPLLDIEPGNPFYTEKRAQMTVEQLVDELSAEYDRIEKFTAGLSDAQLGRKAHIPMIRDTPMGEYPTLAMWINAIAEYHLGFHIDQMKEILQALGKR